MNQPAWRLDPDRAHGRASLRIAPSRSTGSPRAISSSEPATGRSSRFDGVRGLLLNVGGDLRTRGDIECPIGIAAPWADSESSEPLVFIEAANRSVATSGRSQRGFPDRRPVVFSRH